jgi:small subunit ribosomal protein S20
VANTKSAEKQNRQSIKHRARNSSITSAVRTEVRKAREAIEGEDATAAAAKVKAATKVLAKAASKGVIHKVQARRRIGRLAKAAHAKVKAAAAAKPS